MRPVRLLALIFCAVLGAAVAAWAGDRPPVGERYLDAPPELEPRTSESLRRYVEWLLVRRFVTPQDIYNPPLPGTEGFFLDCVRPQRAYPVLAERVSAVSGGVAALAAAEPGGRISVWSDWPRKRASLPGGEEAAALAIGPGSPWVAAAGSRAGSLYVFDLREPSAPAVSLPTGGRVAGLALSENGTWLAAVREDGALLLGSPQGGLSALAQLESPSLLVGFTPFQGVLVSVEADGRVLLWGTRTGELIRAFQITGGPFVEARLSGRSLALRSAEGVETFWDVLDRKRLDLEADPAGAPQWLYVKDGRLVFSTGLIRWAVERRMRIPEMILSHSESAGVFRLMDLDGYVRYYDGSDGRLLEGSAPGGAARDYKLVALDADGVGQAGGLSVRVADPVVRKGDQVLWCRYIPKQGFYLWWRDGAPDRPFASAPMALPVRAGLRADVPPRWQDLLEGRLP